MEATQRLESTARLLKRVRGGDPAALARLRSIYLPILRRWAGGQAPAEQRERLEPLTRACMDEALARVQSLPPRDEGAFLCGLRDAMLATLQAENRQAHAPRLADMVGSATLGAYSQALSRLPEDCRAALVLRLEFGFSFEDLAEALELADAEAARERVRDAILRLADMIEGRTT